jgi:tetratricopeptide (TPR) repeat protein
LADTGAFENHPRLDVNVKVPYEWFLEGNYARALKEYRQLLEKNKQDRDVSEEVLINNGYGLINDNNIPSSKEMFKIVLSLYPASSNAYYGYGQAYLKNNEKGLAITNFKKSLELDPKNVDSRNMLNELEKKVN